MAAHRLICADCGQDLGPASTKLRMIAERHPYPASYYGKDRRTLCWDCAAKEFGWTAPVMPDWPAKVVAQ
jgi:hypothetical protein